MSRKNIIFIVILTITVAALLISFVGTTINNVNETVKNSCFDELTVSSKRLAENLRETTDMDRTILKAMASLISSRDQISNAEICAIMNSYNTTASYLSYIELLFPDNTMLDSNGNVRNVSEMLSFDDEVQKGTYVSDIRQSTLDNTQKVIRNTVPVIKNGKTIYILFGTIRLSEFADKFSTDIYDGHAYVYLEDGDTGNFLLDTWHSTLGNINDFKDRKTLPGYSFDSAIQDLQDGKGGNLAFVSSEKNATQYMHYEPVGINNWNIYITLEEGYALGKVNSISSDLYLMAEVIAGTLLVYIVCVSICIMSSYKQVHKLGTQDQTTGLLNRNAYSKYILDNKNKKFSRICCVYIDANGLHELNNKYGHSVGDHMLCIIADSLKNEFAKKSVYRIGGDEYVVFAEDMDLCLCKEKIENAIKKIQAHDYCVSVGIICRENEIGVERIIQEADEQMLVNKREYYKEYNIQRNR